MLPLRPDLPLARATAPLAADLEDETVLMSLETGSYYGLEGTARRIWTLLETPRTLAALAEQLAAEYDVTPERCAEEIRPFIEELRREGLLVVDG
ncbi:MAG: PqqD family protein [Holophagaceae bacterium]|nr:PqqD family protein [Holophagaceae bacterium]